MEEALLALFKATAGITAVVGQRVYCGFAPQTAELPYILITEMGSNENVDLTSTGALRFVDLDIDCKSRTRVQARSLAKIVRQFIDDFTGAAGSETIRAVLMGPSRTDFEPPVDQSDIGIHSVTMDIQVQYTES